MEHVLEREQPEWPPAERRDALPHNPAHRRAAGLNPGNRFEAHRFHHAEEDRQHRHAETLAEGGDPNAAVRVPLQVIPDATRRIIHRVEQTSDMPFDWTLNPYRGCEHGCIYCYARPYHEFLGYSSGLDFETKIVAKHDAPALLERELASPRWAGEPIVMSAITDVYQHLEAKLKLTRQCLQVLADCRQPVSTMTKGALVLRDLDLWQQLAGHNAGRVTVTLVTLDEALARALEPRATSPAGRLGVIRKLSAAGVPVSVNVAPVIPGLTDTEVPAILEAVAEAGARHVRWVMLRLPYQLKALFLEWLGRNVHPERAKHIESRIRQMHEGKLYHAGPRRGRGNGPAAVQVASLFEVFTRKHGLNRDGRALSSAAFRRPAASGRKGQMTLF
ncbi:MAG: PA0069 family radical SAM protein [Phycisphaerae bacterium]